MTCEICTHPKLLGIEEQLIADTPYQTIALACLVTARALELHARHWRRRPLSAFSEFDSRFETMTPEQRLRALILDLEQLFRNALEDRNLSLASTLLRRQRCLLNQLDRLSDPLTAGRESVLEARRELLRKHARSEQESHEMFRREREMVGNFFRRHPDAHALFQKEEPLLSPDSDPTQSPVPL